MPTRLAFHDPDQIRITRQARKDIDALAPRLRAKLRDILVHVIAENPYEGKRLLGDLAGSYSLRLTYKDRIVYSINEAARTVYIERARTHDGD
ncbi:MAG: toxin of toxin-antitoxin system [Elusimicrobia bacterium RIFCSPLOWO2_12_FULL_59_9]|nr:MAG: toxin of toxin-antitoxin system [Elusimicrobia bacterium RIFCSPLOWO2_12_FULL_59_9]